MSAQSSILNSVRQIPTADAIRNEHHISLVDGERSQEDVEENRGAEYSDSEATTAPPTPGPTPLSQKLTRNSSGLRQSVKQQYTKKKYAKYGRERYNLDDIATPSEEEPSSRPQVGETTTAAQTSYLERSRAKAKSYLKRKRTLGKGKDERDSVVDILYENQRGLFFFGIPKYSSSSLLPSDPRPWQNALFRTSPVDIRNAQVPDPSWEWAWKSWYVDMSRDVDEEGWEYSFQFSTNFAWHGNHPWFHSFVRRRRWLRMRRRRDLHHHTKEKAHELTAEYFTIHPKTLRSSRGDREEIASSELAKLQEKSDDSEAEKSEITDIGSLVRVMRKAAVDREKLVAVRKFMEQGGDELYYLSDRMPEIMNLFIFQNSRRQLLSDLLRRFGDARDRRENLKDHTHKDEDAQKEHDEATKDADNLMNAVKAADEQVKKLEYWSDIKDMAHHGETLQQSSEGHWDLSKWQGLSPIQGEDHPENVFKSKQKATDGVRDLHKHPEHETSDSAAPSKKSSLWFDAKQSNKDSSEDTTVERYYTPAEFASDVPFQASRRVNSKYSVTKVDGANETNLEDTEDFASANIPTARTSSKQKVQIVEPVPEPIDDREPGGRGGGGDDS